MNKERDAVFARAKEIADTKCIRLLARVDQKRAELKRLEAKLTEERKAYGKRRGMDYFNEWNLRNTIAFERGLEDAADRNDWEKAHG